MICTYCPYGGRILDNTAGTGVCLMAGILTGRRVVAVDKDKGCLDAGEGRAKRFLCYAMENGIIAPEDGRPLKAHDVGSSWVTVCYPSCFVLI